MKQRGFTLIELVMTLVIIGVLAAFALPRFLDLSGDARTAAVNALAGSVEVTASNWRMKCASKPGCPMTTGVYSLTVGGQTAQMWNGWPDAGDTLGSNEIDMLVVAQGFQVVLTSGQNTIWQMVSAPDPANCSVQYHEAVTSGSEPTVTVKTTGC